MQDAYASMHAIHNPGAVMHCRGGRIAAASDHRTQVELALQIWDAGTRDYDSYAAGASSASSVSVTPKLRGARPTIHTISLFAGA